MKTRLRHALALMLAALALLALPQGALALESGDWVYEIEDGGCTITKYNGREADLVIPERIGGYPVRKIGKILHWNDGFRENSYLRSVVIPDGVTTIGDDVFHGCRSLKSVKIPDSVTKIGSGAFSFCYALEHITIPYGVKAIETSTFWSCNALRSVIIPDSVTCIDAIAFSSCSSLTEVTIPAGVTDLGMSVFGSCSSLRNVTILDDSIRTSFGFDDAFGGVSEDCVFHVKCNTNVEKGLQEAGFTLDITHSETARDPAYTPTCIQSGRTEGSHCARCHTVFVEQQVVPALGHDPVIDPEVPATMMDTGLTEGSHCRRCGAVLKAQEIIPAKDAVKSIKFSKSRYRLRVNETIPLYANCVMASGAKMVNQFVTFKSSDPSIISVDEYGNATARKHGHATITATAENGVSASCTVKTFIW